MGISKKSSGIKSDYDLARKFFVIKKKIQIFFNLMKITFFAQTNLVNSYNNHPLFLQQQK
ncbi:hypothetical protein C5471_09540 [Photorhabdus tasmaniensis]|uniref:Uncharacterized protein n=1 Tax=Photorhabdus tasmaniensis TaxID=1004159 RepID=A0ABX0GI40_9GAMM|nr:hypothetical protein [Photorhabdus tasmaniensis]